MRVHDLMTRPPLTIHDSDDVALGLQVMAWGGIRHLPVLHDERLVGVVSERDLLASRHANPPIGQVMTSPAQVAAPDDDVTDAARRMVDARLGCLPVLDRGRLIGIVTVTDVVAAQAAPVPARDLRVPVSAVMTRDPLTVSPDDLLLEAVRRISDRRVRHAPVVDPERRVIGMLSDRDIRLALGGSLLAEGDGEAAARIRLLKVRDAMSREPALVRASAPLAEAAAAFLHGAFGALPVVDERGHLAGILSYVDVLRALVEGREGTPAHG